jgi:hypothetical protein
MEIANNLTKKALNEITEYHPEAVLHDLTYRHHRVWGTFRDLTTIYNFECEIVDGKVTFTKQVGATV